MTTVPTSQPINIQLGIDLGGTKTEIIALAPDLKNSSESRIVLRERIATPADCGDSGRRYENILNTISTLVSKAEQHLQTTFDQPFTTTLGIGIPGAISPQTRLVKNANTTCLIGKPFEEDLKEYLKRELLIANDADCFVLSEASDGAGANSNSVFGVIIGTGCGGGIAINKNLISGPNAIAGEWGHNPLPWAKASDQMNKCYCGKSGCIETFLSGPGFSQHANRLFPVTDTLNATQWHQALSEKKPQALQAYDLYTDWLARGLASVINILDPEVIVLGGGMSNVGYLYQHLPSKLDRYVFSDSVQTRIVKAQHGDSSGVRGAAWLGASATSDGSFL